MVGCFIGPPLLYTTKGDRKVTFDELKSYFRQGGVILQDDEPLPLVDWAEIANNAKTC